MTQKVEYDIIARDRATNTFDKIGGSADKAGGKLSGFGKKMGLAVAAGAAIAGAAAIKFGFDAIGAASDLNETINKTDAVFGKNAKQIKKWADDSARNLGLPTQSALAVSSSFGDMFLQLGVGGKDAAKMSKDVVQLSADLGSFNNLETADVADRMSAAFRGEYDSLQAVIPNINAARVEKEALAATGKTVAKELTAEEKAMATLAIVQKDGARANGDFAKTSDGLANQQKILSAQFADVKASIGQKLLPVAVAFVSWMNDKFIPGAKKAGEWLSDKLGPAFSKLGDWIQEKAVPAFKQFGEDVLPSLKDGLKNAEGATKDIKPFLKILGEIVTNVVLPGLEIAARVVLPLLGTHLRQTARFWGKMGEAAKVMWNSVLQPVLKFIVKGIGLVVGAWAEMFGAMASIPGAPKWVGKTAAALDAAAEKAFKLANGIRDIPEDKKVTVTTTYVRRGVKSDGTPGQIEAYAKGTKFHPGGMAWVGEEGPELVDLPRGSKVLTARESARLTSSPSGMGGMDPRDMAKALREAFRDGIEIRLTGGNPGQHAYLQTGATAR